MVPVFLLFFFLLELDLLLPSRHQMRAFFLKNGEVYSKTTLFFSQSSFRMKKYIIWWFCNDNLKAKGHEQKNARKSGPSRLLTIKFTGTLRNYRILKVLLTCNVLSISLKSLENTRESSLSEGESFGSTKISIDIPLFSRISILRR